MVYSGAVEVRPFQAKMRLIVSEAEGLSFEAVKRNPTGTVIPGVDENKSLITRYVNRTRFSVLHAVEGSYCFF